MIPPYALPRAPFWILAALPWRLVYTYLLLDLITRRGAGRAHMGHLAALRGVSVRALQYQFAELEAAGFLRIEENRVCYDWCEANTFIFLRDRNPNESKPSGNCILSAVALKTSTTHTANHPMKGKETAKVSHREKMEAIWQENHPAEQRIDWYKRRKNRQNLNRSPEAREMREAYNAQGIVWDAVDRWRKDNPRPPTWAAQTNKLMMSAARAKVAELTADDRAQERRDPRQFWTDRIKPLGDSNR